MVRIIAIGSRIAFFCAIGESIRQAGTCAFVLSRLSIQVYTDFIPPGSFGSVPNPVRQAGDELTALIERNPDKFMRLTFAPLLEHVRERLAKFIGAETDEL